MQFFNFLIRLFADESTAARLTADERSDSFSNTVSSCIPDQQPPEVSLMAINTEKLGYVLQTFVTTTPDIQGALVVTPDGLPLSGYLPADMDEERVSAMSAAMLSLGERIGMELVRGTIDRIFLEGTEGFSVLTNCGEDAVFLVLASKAVKQGVLMVEIKRAVAELKLVL